ncbi:MAG: ribosome small subunit-dependent GTPase A [Deltaproteobacteria bacterium]|nr:ribosome small subunit-dependent GTPase A [Deltaproteobacteria bacterium]MBT6488689.1 ribosome small subunit-dependent GTPase A [Deltaproteobacteria bacterium]
MRGKPGRVVETVGRRVRVVDEAGERVCYLAGKRAVVGDRVMWEEAPGTGGKLVTVLERDSELRRRDNQGKDRVLAANLQGVVVVMSPSRPAFNANLMDRYLVAIAAAGLKGAICLNKIDLETSEEVEADLSLRESLGYPILRTCSKDGRGLSEVVELIGERSDAGSWAFMGLSGVGKTSLVAALLPEQDVGAIGEVSEHWEQGQHTTTYSKIFSLPQGGEVCDSPGIRTFSPAGLTREQVRDFYPGMGDLRCQFRDCEHREGQKGCEAPEALNDSMLKAYRRLLEWVDAQREY